MAHRPHTATMTLTVGSLFTGIGGLDLGLERAGMTVAWQSEIDPYCCRVLAKHWPTVPNLGDVTTIDWEAVEPVDLICGGYPCQPFSLAGARAGADDPRHLWPRMRDAIRMVRPRLALLENVPGHLSMGFGDVLADLAALGYDCEWDCIPAAAVGAPHLRYRVFVVAHANSESEPGSAVDAVSRSGELVLADTGSPRRRQDTRSTPSDEGQDAGWTTADDHVADRDGESGRTRHLADADVEGPQGRQQRLRGASERTVGACRGADAGHWSVEPDVGRVAHGIPHRVDRLRALGNAVVPAVAEWVGRRILDAVA